MLLQRLVEYADRSELPPTLYVQAPVRYVVELDASGRLLNPEPTDTATPTERKLRRGAPRLVPQIARSSAVRPLLLADNSEYVLGLVRDETKQPRAASYHAAFVGLVERCATETAEPAVLAALDFLRSDPTSQLELPTDFDRGDTITFRVDGRFVIDVPAVQAFWARINDPANAEGPAIVMQCLICGQERPVLSRLQGKIKGVPGGQTAGTSIISANAEAFESYGLAASLIAPTCASCGERFTRAANELLRGETSHIRIGDSAAFVFWTREKVDYSFFELLTSPTAEQVRDLVASVWTARTPEIEGASFYATVLSGSGGRTVVRDWIDTTVGEALRQLSNWFARQAIVDDWGQEPRPLGLFALAVSTVREAKDIPPTTPRALLHSALTGAPLPWSLLYQAVRRNRAEQGVTRARAALTKLVLCSHHPESEEAMIAIDPSSTSAAYRCGRLLAVLEEIQRLAIPGAKATIVDRFFGTASSAPASVFGRLMRGAQPHLARLERDRPGAYRALQRRLEEIVSGLPAFPRTLTLQDQGLFSLGYYHQRAFDRAQAREAAARRRANGPVSTTEADDHSALELTTEEDN